MIMQSCSKNVNLTKNVSLVLCLGSVRVRGGEEEALSYLVYTHVPKLLKKLLIEYCSINFIL